MPKPVAKALKSIRKDKLKTLQGRLKKLTEQIERHPDNLRARLREIRGIPHDQIEQELINTGRLTRLKFSWEFCGYDAGELYTCHIELDNVAKVFKGTHMGSEQRWFSEVDDDNFIFDDDGGDDECKDWTWRRVLRAACNRCTNTTDAIALALASLWAYTQRGRELM